MGQNKRMQQLDGLRAVAFILVTLAHAGVVLPMISLGMAGVGIFFVLSGMLITGILLDTREEIPSKNISRLFALRQFYIRRLLRLVPLLYSVLAISILIGLPPFTYSWPWHFLYLSNFYQYLYGWQGWGSNLWTLAIEEQYYLVWPWVVLFAPRRLIVRCLILSIIAAPAFRIIMISLGTVEAGGLRIGDPNLIPVAQLDCLSAGGLLAAAQRGLTYNSPENLATRFGLVGFVSWLIFSSMPGTGCIAETSQAFVWLYVVHRCSVGVRGRSGKFLSSLPVVYLGKISYGVCSLPHFSGMPSRARSIALSNCFHILGSEFDRREVKFFGGPESRSISRDEHRSAQHMGQPDIVRGSLSKTTFTLRVGAIVLLLKMTTNQKLIDSLIKNLPEARF